MGLFDRIFKKDQPQKPTEPRQPEKQGPLEQLKPSEEQQPTLGSLGDQTSEPAPPPVLTNLQAIAGTLAKSGPEMPEAVKQQPAAPWNAEEQAILSQEGNWQQLTERAAALAQQQRIPLAVALYEKALAAMSKTDEEPTFSVRSALAKLYLEQQQPEAAAAHYLYAYSENKNAQGKPYLPQSLDKALGKTLRECGIDNAGKQALLGKTAQQGIATALSDLQKHCQSAKTEV